MTSATPQDLYPPSLAGIPKDLTRPDPAYGRQVVIVLVSLLLFLAFYLALIAGAGWLFWWSLSYDMIDVNRFTLFLKVAAVAICGMLFLFMVKALFKRHKRDEDLQIEVTERDQPELFAFIRKLTKETGAPFPYKVFLSPDVNAAVFYNTSLINLIFPVRKNLLIGLGLVNALTLSEFKAVLAHEFGHFSQSSMRLGSYVYVANRIIADLVFQRDYWDNLLVQWKNAGDWRVSAPAWLLYGIVWVLRMVLGAAFHLINLGEAALSRQMEFHADLVAVSVTGSDSLIHALSRLNFANESLMQALQDLKDASDHRLYTQDLYFHQSTAATHLRRVKNDETLGAPPQLPDDPRKQSRVFQPGEHENHSMYASHPPNHEREENAKRHYFRSVPDDRSPWLLFRDPDGIRAAMTAAFYKEHLPLPAGIAPADPASVQAFIDEEHAERMQDPRYFGLYDGRVMELGDLTQLVHEVYHHPWSPERLLAAYRRLYEGQLKAFAEAHGRRDKEQDLLREIKSGEIKPRGGVFTFREQQRKVDEAEELLKIVDEELEQDREELKKLDVEVFQAHYQMARTLGNDSDEELWARYQFHLAAQEITKNTSIELVRLSAVLEYAAGQETRSEGDFAEILRILREGRTALANAMAQATQLGLPALRNLQAGAALSSFLLEEPLVEDVPAVSNSISGQWVGRLMKQLSQVQSKGRRLHFKSLGAILALQERIAEQWLQTQPGAGERSEEAALRT
jgi:Zn-dependent protease with chaperone function